jgi:hypothetical protein
MWRFPGQGSLGQKSEVDADKLRRRGVDIAYKIEGLRLALMESPPAKGGSLKPILTSAKTEFS